MTEEEEQRLQQSKQLFEDFFPGVVARLEKIPGQFRSSPKVPRWVKAEGKRVANMGLLYRTHQRDLRIDLRINLDVYDGRFEMPYHSYHIGPWANEDEYILRLCENPNQSVGPPHHFHLRGWEMVYQNGHIPASRAEPPLSKSPLDFLDIAEHIVKTNKSLIGVKK